MDSFSTTGGSDYVMGSGWGLAPLGYIPPGGFRPKPGNFEGPRIDRDRLPQQFTVDQMYDVGDTSNFNIAIKAAGLSGKYVRARVYSSGGGFDLPAVLVQGTADVIVKVPKALAYSCQGGTMSLNFVYGPSASDGWEGVSRDYSYSVARDRYDPPSPSILGYLVKVADYSIARGRPVTARITADNTESVSIGPQTMPNSGSADFNFSAHAAKIDAWKRANRDLCINYTVEYRDPADPTRKSSHYFSRVLIA